MLNYLLKNTTFIPFVQHLDVRDLNKLHQQGVLSYAKNNADKCVVIHCNQGEFELVYFEVTPVPEKHWHEYFRYYDDYQAFNSLITEISKKLPIQEQTPICIGVLIDF